MHSCEREHVAKNSTARMPPKMGRGAKYAPCSCRSEVSQRQDEQDEAQPVPKESERRGRRDRSKARHGVPQAQREADVDHAGDDTLQAGDQDRVAG